MFAQGLVSRLSLSRAALAALGECVASLAGAHDRQTRVQSQSGNAMVQPVPSDLKVLQGGEMWAEDDDEQQSRGTRHISARQVGHNCHHLCEIPLAAVLL